MALKRPTPAPQEEVNFGSDDFYAAGGLIPEGNYALAFLIRMYQAVNQTTQQPIGPNRLGVMVSFYSLDEPERKMVDKFYGMGKNAHKSYAPNPETGKGLVLVPGGPKVPLSDSTNWNIFRKSLYDSGLPQGLLSNDISVIDGIHVHIANVAEPESRKEMGKNKMGEAAQEQQEERMGSGFIPVVTEIKEDGKPWEGTGGIPGEEPSAPAPAPKAPAKVAGKITPKPAAKPAPAPVAEAPSDEDAVQTAALEGIATVLGDPKNANGMMKVALRIATFKALTASQGKEVADAVISTYFGSDDTLNVVLGELGYSVQGTQVKPV